MGCAGSRRATIAHAESAQTLRATALVHESYLRLQGDHAHSWNSRGHFFAAAAGLNNRDLFWKSYGEIDRQNSPLLLDGDFRRP